MDFLEAHQFWHGIYVLIDHYELVNRRIFKTIIHRVRKVVRPEGAISFDSTPWQRLNSDELDALCSDIDREDIESCMENIDELSNDILGLIINLKFLNKKADGFVTAEGFVDFRNSSSYTCKFIGSELDDFSISLRNGEIEIKILTSRLPDEDSNRWAEYVLKPKFMGLCKNVLSNRNPEGVLKSLQLIDLECYNELYKKFKQKYSKAVQQIWLDAKETTDPSKYIHEDLAIAAYLITLWRYGCRGNGSSLPFTAFADLGCGNGLLVHILNAEGYKGYGYDIRSRKIWSFYPSSTENQLFELAIEPGTFRVPSEVDWLIGNHSDELSPWLPVLAATASHRMQYFLLPCCAYELSGVKYQRRSTKFSTYTDFYRYVERLSIKCGFETALDRLTIPSTKRYALIGSERTHEGSGHEEKCKKIWEFVNEEKLSHGSAIGGDIKLREKIEAVRNCTQIDKGIIDDLVLKIFSLLMESQESGEANVVITWQPGGRLRMREIVMKLSREDLKHIKAECGGIKTLLRNKHEIFEFCGSDFVGIKKPKLLPRSSNKPQTFKKRLCFFKTHHPNGCPLSDEECSFVH